MINVIRLQGKIFCALALLVAVLSLVLPVVDKRLELIVIGSLIVLLGVPHGAMDTIFAKSIYGVNNMRGWAIFGLLYLLTAALVVGLWLLAPALFLLGFLLISIAHFSGDPVAGIRRVSRLLYGGAVIVLPVIYHRVEIDHLFGLLAGADAAAAVTVGLDWLGWPWLIALILAALFELKYNVQTGCELLALALLSVLVTPLIAFTIFFCAMHSARHILRTVDYSHGTSHLLLLTMSVVPMIAVIIAIFAAWNLLSHVSLDARLIQIVFVGLAALTVPHMALVERVRLSGWERQLQ